MIKAATTAAELADLLLADQVIVKDVQLARTPTVAGDGVDDKSIDEVCNLLAFGELPDAVEGSSAEGLSARIGLHAERDLNDIGGSEVRLCAQRFAEAFVDRFDLRDLRPPYAQLQHPYAREVVEHLRDIAAHEWLEADLRSVRAAACLQVTCAARQAWPVEVELAAHDVLLEHLDMDLLYEALSRPQLQV